jgi:D-beta-D-heptose 7-phosphate kinase/D-beta-D-heptose 1-phosphate adenosyltransferase
LKLSPAKLQRIVRSLRGRCIAVVGDLMLDRYVWGTATRLSPEAAVPVVDFVEETACLGGAGNVAANAAAYGGRVLTFGAVGDDEFGRALRAELRARALPDRGVVADPSRKTTVKTRIIARHQQVVRVDRETREPISPAMQERLIRLILASLRPPRRVHALVISDYDKGAVTEELAGRLLAACSRLRLPAFVKPKWSRLPTYPGATAIVLNRAEASFLVTRTLDDDESIEHAARALLDHFKCPALVITRGERGITVAEQDARGAFHISATSHEAPYGPAASGLGHGAAPRLPGGRARQVFDVTGAGDTVLATFALACSAGATFREAAVLANAAAGVVVGKLGTATVAPAELLAALRDAV